MKKNLVTLIFIIGLVSLIVALMGYAVWVRQSHDTDVPVETLEPIEDYLTSDLPIVTEVSDILDTPEVSDIPVPTDFYDYDLENSEPDLGTDVPELNLEDYVGEIDWSTVWRYDPGEEDWGDSDEREIQRELDYMTPAIPIMKVVPFDVPYTPVEYSELETIATYIKYGTDLEKNMPLFKEKLEAYLRDHVGIREGFENDNMRVSNVNSLNLEIGIVIVDDRVEGTSTLFICNMIKGHQNRVDCVSIIQNMEYCSHTFTKSGKPLIMYNNLDCSRYLITSIDAIDGVPKMTSYVLMLECVDFSRGSLDEAKIGGKDFGLEVRDGIITFLNSNGEVILEGEAYEEAG